MEYLVYKTERTMEQEMKTHYGICCRCPDEFFVTEALSTERERVMKLAEELNNGELEKVHLEDVLNDWIVGHSLSTQTQ